MAPDVTAIMILSGPHNQARAATTAYHYKQVPALASWPVDTGMEANDVQVVREHNPRPYTYTLPLTRL